MNLYRDPRIREQRKFSQDPEPISDPILWFVDPRILLSDDHWLLQLSKQNNPEEEQNFHILLIYQRGRSSHLESAFDNEEKEQTKI